MDLDLSGIFHFALDPLCDVMRDDDHLIVIDLFGFDDDSDLTTGLDSEGVLDSAIGVGDLFEFLQTLDVVLDVLAAGAGTGGGDGIGRLYDEGDGGLRFDVSVVRLDGVNDGFAFTVLLRGICAEGDMGPFELVVEGFTDVVEQAGASRLFDVSAQFRGDESGDVADLQRMVQNVLAVAGAVAEFTEQFDELGVEAGDTGVQNSPFTGLFDDGCGRPG